MSETAKKKRITVRQIKTVLTSKPAHVVCTHYQRIGKVHYFPTYRQEVRRRLLDDDVRQALTSNFLQGFAQAARQRPLLVLHLPQAEVDRISRLEERCDHLESRLADLTQKLCEWQPYISHRPDARKRFDELVQEWRRTRGHSSKIKDLIDNAAYREIIGMGPPAIPLILEELERQPGHWSAALRAISGEDPIPPAARGRLDQEAAVWLQWGRDKNCR